MTIAKNAERKDEVFKSPHGDTENEGLAHLGANRSGDACDAEVVVGLFPDETKVEWDATGFQFGGSLDERLRSVAIGEDQDAGGTIRIRERERVLNGKIGPGQRAVSRKDRRIAPSLLEDFGGVVDEEELVFARWFRAAQKFLPLGEALVDEVFGRIGAIKDDPEIDAVLVLLVLGVGEQKNEGEKCDDPERAPKLETGPETSCKEQDGEEEEPLWRFEDQTDNLLGKWGM